MNSKLVKLESFVDSLTKNNLSENQQVTLFINLNNAIGGASNPSSCLNTGTTCANQTNDKSCTNQTKDGCLHTINHGNCINKDAEIAFAAI